MVPRPDLRHGLCRLKSMLELLVHLDPIILRLSSDTSVVHFWGSGTDAFLSISHLRTLFHNWHLIWGT